MIDFAISERIAAVTGGESGIGAACGIALAEAGADVAVLYFRDKAAADANVTLIEAAGRRGLAVQADVSDETSVTRAFDQIEAGLGVVDILVNSAGRNMSGVTVEEMTTDQWRTMIATDLTGSFFTTRLFLQRRRASTRSQAGTIINITSIHAKAMRAGGADHDAAKGGQLNLTRTVALEAAALGVTVNAVAPGMILTAMNKAAVDDASVRDQKAKAIPLQRPGTPDDVAGAVVFLASPAGSYVTGSTITVDGGLSLEVGQGA